jgi:hypothetical protein
MFLSKRIAFPEKTAATAAWSRSRFVDPGVFVAPLYISLLQCQVGMGCLAEALALSMAAFSEISARSRDIVF